MSINMSMTNDPPILTRLNLMKNSEILTRDFLLPNTINYLPAITKI